MVDHTTRGKTSARDHKLTTLTHCHFETMKTLYQIYCVWPTIWAMILTYVDTCPLDSAKLRALVDTEMTKRYGDYWTSNMTPGSIYKVVKFELGVGRALEHTVQEYVGFDALCAEIMPSVKRANIKAERAKLEEKLKELDRELDALAMDK